MIGWMLATAALAGVDPVIEATYLWETGQDARAIEVIEAAHASAPRDLGVHRVRIAMRVGNGAGGPLEAEYRDWFYQDREDPVRRVALAYALAYRSTEPGQWCDDADALVSTIDGSDLELLYYARRAALVAHERCGREPDVDRAELLKIADNGGPGKEDATVHSVTNGYAGADAPPKIKELLAAHPRFIDRMLPLWSDDAGGPALAPARTAVLSAAKSAAKSDNPRAVLAATRLYRGIGKSGPADKAQAQLASLDKAADSTLDRHIDEVSDPPIYAKIDKALRGDDPAKKLEKLDALEGEVGDRGSAAAHYQAVRVDLLAEVDRHDEAFEAAKKAWMIMRDNPTYAETFARKAAGVGKDLELALEALDIAAANPDHPRRAIHLLVRAKLNIGLEKLDEAESALLALLALEPTGRVVHRNLGDLYVAMDKKNAAIYHYMLATNDPEEKGDKRSKKAVEELLGDDDPYIAGPEALVGKAIELEGLPEHKGKMNVVLAIPSWHPEAERAVADLAEWAAKGKGPATVVLVDRDAGTVVDLKAKAGQAEIIHLGPKAVRALSMHHVPHWVVRDARGKVKAAGDGEVIKAAL